MGQETECVLALLAGQDKYTNKQVLSDQEIFEGIKGAHSKAVYANTADRYVNKVLGTQNAGLFRDTLNYVADGTAIIGDGAVSEIEAVFKDFLSKYKPTRQNEAVFKQEFAPRIRDIANRTMQSAPTEKLNLMDNYFKHQERGGSLYGQKQHTNPFGRMAQNAVGNLVSWNPMITTMNAFEFTPKAAAYALSKGRPDAVIKGIARYMQETGGQFWKKIPDLETKGVYGTKEHLGSGFNLLDVTENPLRGISYYVGEAIQPGLGSEALEKIAFVHRYGNEPLVYLDHQGTLSFTLMRYSLTATKFYLNMLKGVAKGDPKAAVALLAFSTMTAVQTGGRSAVPLPVDAGLTAVMGDDYADAMKEFDDATGLNFSAKYLGTDLTQYAQPVGGLALGAGYNIATQDVAGGFRAVNKGIENTAEGNYAAAGANFLQAVMGFGQVGRFKGVNLTTKRMADVLAEVAAGDVEADPVEVLLELGDKTNVYNPPQE